ncbi:hypothetical protein FACS1894111_06490 [Clostridia bacterium]|nr:hypothetical protein FACS1894111_06490 [Clostridia bacterium]
MKKPIILILTLALALLTACGSKGANTGITATTNPPTLTDSGTESGNLGEDTETTALDPNTDTPNPNAGTTEADTPPVPATVYMTTDLSPKGLQAVYDALGIKPTAEDKVGVKVSTGEPPASNYLRQELIGDFVKGLGGTYLECNTIFGTQRASFAMHYQVAKDHGFQPIVLMDDGGELKLPVDGGLRLKTDVVGTHIGDFNFHVVLSHFKGHPMGGYGGALKNTSVGYASAKGKSFIHTAGKDGTQIYGGSQDAFLESMADAAKSVVQYVRSLERGQIIYINVMNRLSIDCDCMGNPAEPDIHDIGILASSDPVALDRACLDLIYKAKGNEAFVQRVESLNGAHVMEAAEQIGLGTRSYALVSVDD